MCKGSHAVSVTTTAEDRTTLGIGTVRTHAASNVPARDVGAFHKSGQTVADCVHCVQTGQKLTLSRIPAAIQKELGLGDTEVATFVQDPSWHQDDRLVFERNGATIDLSRLANQGVAAYVGVKAPDIKGAVDKLMQDATTGAAAAGKANESGTGAAETPEPVGVH